MYDRSFPVGRRASRIASGMVQIHKKSRTASGTAGPVQVETLRLCPTRASQCALDSAIQIRHGRAVLLGASAETMEQTQQNYECATRISLFYRVTAKALIGAEHPVTICGLGVSRKWVISGKCSSEGGKTLPERCSRMSLDRGWTAVLRLELKESFEGKRMGHEVLDVPPCICDLFDNDLYFGREGRKLYLKVCRYPGRIFQN